MVLGFRRLIRQLLLGCRMWGRNILAGGKSGPATFFRLHPFFCPVERYDVIQFSLTLTPLTEPSRSIFI